MEIFRVKNDIPFLKYRKIAALISILTFVMAFFFLFQKGLNYGVDFTGGTIIEISISYSVSIGASFLTNKAIIKDRKTKKNKDEVYPLLRLLTEKLF